MRLVSFKEDFISVFSIQFFILGLQPSRAVRTQRTFNRALLQTTTHSTVQIFLSKFFIGGISLWQDCSFRKIFSHLEYTKHSPVPWKRSVFLIVKGATTFWPQIEIVKVCGLISNIIGEKYMWTLFPLTKRWHLESAFVVSTT